MALLNHAARELTVRLVYYGPEFSGKTTNMRWLHERIASNATGRLVTLETDTDRTLFFEFFPVDLGGVSGLRTRLQLYTVAGEVRCEQTRRAVLRGCDALVFVADSQASMLDGNEESLRGLREHLLASEVDPELPRVIQYNKRDLTGALPLALLEARLNPEGLPSFPAVATRGVGVEETLRAAAGRLFERLTGGERGPEPVAEEPSVPRDPGQSAPLVRPHGPKLTAGASEATRSGAEPAPMPRPASPEPRPDGEGLGPDEWVYLLDGERRGPIQHEALVDLLLSSLPEDTKVWQPGMTTWERANRVPKVAQEIPPPVPVSSALGAGSGGDDFPDFESVPRMLRTVLIADEDASFRRYLAMPLAAQGFAIHEAGDGAAAWQLAVQEKPWMILADLSMPEVDGFEFCRRVRSHPLLSRKPVVFISGSDKYKDRYRALQIGADDFLSKSMPIRELLIRMQLVMTRYSEIRAWELADGRGGLTGALEGRIEVFGTPALLQICSMRRLTGLLSVTSADGTHGAAVVGFREGAVATALVDNVAAAEGVYAFLTWQTGSFRIVPGDSGAGTPIAMSVEELLAEGCRRLVEAHRGGSQTP